MKPINIENLMGHSTGISDSYYRPTENDLLQDFLLCVDALTIEKDEKVLQKQVEQLREKGKDSEYIVNAKMQEKDEQLKTMQDQFNHLQSQVQLLISSIGTIDQTSKNNLAKKMFESGIYSPEKMET
jgi:hypothetical protein